MRVAAVADIHLKAEDHARNVSQFSKANELADVLVIAGDFTNHGLPDEMRTCLSVMEHVHIQIVAVLGNHDHESGNNDELAGMLRLAGVHVLDGQCHEVNGVGFAGTKGFCGGFAPHELTKHERQNAAVPKIFNLDRGIDPQQHRNLLRGAVNAANDERRPLPGFAAIVNAVEIELFGAVQAQRLGARAVEELARQHPELHKIAAMDALEPLGDDRADAEQSGPLRGPIAGRP